MATAGDDPRDPVTTVVLRAATPDDAPVLERWDSKPHVVEHAGGDGPHQWAYELARRVPWRELLIAEVGGRPIGFLEIIDARQDEDHYWGDVEPGLRAIDIWIGDEAYLGRGLGTQTMRQALARCFADASVDAVLIDPLVINVDAHRFSTRLGFEVVGPRVFGTDECLVMRASRERWEAARPG